MYNLTVHPYTRFITPTHIYLKCAMHPQIPAIAPIALGIPTPRAILSLVDKPFGFGVSVTGSAGGVDVEVEPREVVVDDEE